MTPQQPGPAHSTYTRAVGGRRAGRKRTIAAGLFTAILALSSGGAWAQAGNAPVVTIANGRIEGVRTDAGVDAFLGIPYAAAPVRELRWRDPQPVAAWTRTLHADRYAAQCQQPQRPATANQYSGAEITSEDCLYLNVWAKPGVKKAPVIVYIHGGAFFIGSGSMPLYGGASVAQQGAVFVNLNYRLGVLGFLAHPQLSAESPHKTSGDYGFLDQIAALEWVRQNIDKFGGDPNNVTIVGQSAGSMSVLALQASPLAKGLFQRAVGMSGAMLGGGGPMAMRDLATGESEGVKFQQLMKAGDLAAMRNIPADRLIVPRTPGGPAIGAIVDGYVLPRSIATTFEQRKQNDVPLLLGFTHDEALGGFGTVKDVADFRAKAAARFGARAPAFLALYPATSDAEAVQQARLADRDATMASSMKKWAVAQTAGGRAPVYTYMFAHPHSYVPGVTFNDLDPATAGAYHTSEVPFWLGTLDSFNQYRSTRAWTPKDRELSSEMTRSLVAFARSGNPDTAQLRYRAFDQRDPELLKLDTPPVLAPWPDARKLAFFDQAPASAPVSTGSARD